MSYYDANSRRLDCERSVAVIDALGGVMSVCRIFGIKSASVCQWKKRGIPESRLQFIQERYREVPAVFQTLDFTPWKNRSQASNC